MTGIAHMPLGLAYPPSRHGGVRAVEEVSVTADDLKGLIAAVAGDRDRAAYGRLFQYFAPRIIGFMERAGVGRTDAEEIAQETMVTVWRKANLYDSRQAAV